MKKKASSKKTTSKKAPLRSPGVVVAELTRGRGQPTLYKPEYCDTITTFFDVEHYREVEVYNEKTGNSAVKLVGNRMPTLAAFAGSIGVTVQTLWNWGRAHPDFFDAMARAKERTEEMLVANTLLGLYNPHFAQFVAKNYTSMRDIKELEVRNPDSDDAKSPEELKDEITRLERKMQELESQL